MRRVGGGPKQESEQDPTIAASRKRPQRTRSREVMRVQRSLHQTKSQLLKREEDLSTLARRLSEVERWYSATMALSAEVSLCDTEHEALMAVAEMLVDVLGFDQCRVSWGSETIDYPELDDESDRDVIPRLFALVERSKVPWSAEADAENDADGWVLAAHYAVTSLAFPGDLIAVYVACRDASYPPLAGDDGYRVREAFQLLQHPFDALRLRLQLMRDRDQLQTRVREATSEIRRALEDAHDARSAAEHAARVRHDFLAHMSHEIRTPMTAVLACTELLRSAVSRRDQATSDEYCDIIARSGKSLLHLLNDILDLARLESGKSKAELSEGSLVSLLTDVASLMRARASEHALALHLDLEGELPERARTDFSRMRQVLLNVVGNAIKFTPSGEVRIIASAERLPENACTLVVKVEDTGVGIAADELANVFGEFVTSRPHAHGVAPPGSGLGLAITRRLIDGLGGTIRVESELDRGTCFTLAVPIEVERDVTWTRDLATIPRSEGPQALAVRRDASSNNATTHSRGRILVADDTQGIRNAFALLLQSFGIEVDCVEDGQSALDAVRASPSRYDLVFLDMQMPLLDGYETAARLLSLGFERPIIAVTAHVLPGEKERCIDAGCADFLGKPVELPLLEAMLDRYLRRSDETR